MCRASGVFGRDTVCQCIVGSCGDKTDLKQKISNLQGRESGWFENAKEIIMTCNSVKKNVIENNYGNLCQIAKKAGSNFFLKDKALSFSLKKPYEFVFSRISGVNNISGKDLPLSLSAEGARNKFSPLFRNQQTCKDWRCVLSQVRTFLKTPIYNSENNNTST